MIKQDFSILITGDFCPINRIEPLVLDNKVDLIFNNFLPEIRSSDLAITNLEAPVASESRMTNKSGPSLRIPPESLHVLKDAGFGLVTLANNHIMDFGGQGLMETLTACGEFDISSVGSNSNNKLARAIFYTGTENLRIAILNFAENEFGTTNNDLPGAAPLNPIQNFYDIQEAKRKSDKVIVIVHGGHEMYELPSPRMVETYRFFVDIGADAIIGHHTHCVSGYEIYRDAPIFYSLGNFIFDNPNNISKSWCQGLAVKLLISKEKIEFNLIPFNQNCNNIGVSLMTVEDSKLFISKIEKYSEIINDQIQLESRFDEWCSHNKRMYDSFIEPYSFRILHFLRNRGFFPRIITKRKRLLLLNLMRCESHRDVAIKILSE